MAAMMPPEIDPGLRTFLLPAVLAAGSLVAAAALVLRPPAAAPVAAVFPPWWGAARTAVAAGSAGLIVRFGAGPFVVVVMPQGDGSVAALRRAGAWLVVDPQVLGGCGVHGRARS
jgi:hypothetical protein